MKFNFTQLPDKLPYPAAVRAVLSTYHSDVISYVVDHYEGTYSQRKRIVDVLNSISYAVITKDTDWTRLWRSDDPLYSVPYIVDEDECKSSIASLYLIERDINWDVKVSATSQPESKPNTNASVNTPLKPVTPVASSSVSRSTLTPKSDLYIQPPAVPRFDSTKVYAVGDRDGCRYVIYESLPSIPSKQNEISATTDVSKFSEDDLLRLYPNQLIHTRASCMYEQYPGMSYDDRLGVIFPIQGFSVDQIKDNIIRYPHIFRLLKVVDGSTQSFYTTVEIDGELYKISEFWKSLPESDILPYNTDFIKEYVVRRYLLERDVMHIVHKYPMYGSLDPFLTLFMPYTDYRMYGFSDPIQLARACVESRVSYKRTRNPIVRRLQDV